MFAFIPQLDHVSPWLFGVALIALLSLLIETGYQLALKFRGDHGLDKHPVGESVTGTITGLLAFMLAFMLAFTFGGSIARYSDVRSRFAATAMLTGLFLVIVLIVDLDRPVRSFFQTKNNTAQSLRERMQQEESAPKPGQAPETNPQTN